MDILLTGASGFLGGYFMASWRSDHHVVAVGRGAGADIVCDLTREVLPLPAARMVVHAAGLAHLIRGGRNKKPSFDETNVRGTKNLLRALSYDALPQTLVFISSVAVYGAEQGNLLDESVPLLGSSAYAESKINAEKIVVQWGRSVGVSVVILRLPLVIGRNAPGNLQALGRAMRWGYYFRVGSGDARRSMVLAEDVASLIPTLVGKGGVYNLTDGYHPSVAEFDDCYAAKMGKKVHTIPVAVAAAIAKIGDIVPVLPLNSNRLSRLLHTLTFSDEKARNELMWLSRSVVEADW